MAVFPAFAPTIDGVTKWSAEPLSAHFGSYSFPEHIGDISVYFTSFSDRSTLEKSMKSLASAFPRVWALRVFIQNTRGLHDVSSLYA